MIFEISLKFRSLSYEDRERICMKKLEIEVPSPTTEELFQENSVQKVKKKSVKVNKKTNYGPLGSFVGSICKLYETILEKFSTSNNKLFYWDKHLRNCQERHWKQICSIETFDRTMEKFV